MNDQTNLPALPDTAASVLAAFAKGSAGSSGVQYLKFNKDKTWSFGRDNLEPQEGALLRLDPGSLETGWAAWLDGVLLHEAMRSVFQGAIPKASLPPVAAEYKPAASVRMVVLNGEDEGTVMEYKSTSQGGVRELGRIVGLIAARIGAKNRYCFPVVELKASSFRSKRYGDVATPVLDVRSWHDQDGNAEGAALPAPTAADPVAAPVSAPAQAARRRAAVAAPSEAAPAAAAAPAGVQRRRRPAV